jgi:hypothetical protein
MHNISYKLVKHMLQMHHKKQKAETQVHEYIPILWLGKYD